MNGYITVQEAAEKWGVTPRQVQILCKGNRIVGATRISRIWIIPEEAETSVYKGYKRDKIEMRGDRAEISDFPLYLNTVAGGLDYGDQAIGGFCFVVEIYVLPVIEVIG